MSMDYDDRAAVTDASVPSTGQHPLQWPDYFVLASFLAISLGIGLYHALTGGRQKTVSEFIMANRDLQIIPTSISLLVSFQSAIMVLGMTAEMFGYGSQLMVLSISSHTLASIVTVVLFVPWMFPLKLVSVYEYLDLRFSSKILRIFGATLGITSAILYIGAAMYAPSAALESATGMPLMVSIPLMAVVTTTYTALGGMRAVIWTDVFQCLTMIGGMVAILVKGLVVIGGFGNMYHLNNEQGRIQGINWSPDPRMRHTFFGFLIGATVSNTQLYGLMQASVQRFSATKNLASARLTVILNLPGIFIMELMACLIGLIVCAYYASVQCDPLKSGMISNLNQLLPRFVVSMFSSSPGFAGLFLAVLYGAALSSVSSALSGLAANCWEDILKWKLTHIQESTKVLINRVLVIIFGFIATATAFLAASIPGPVSQISWALSSSVMGPLFGLFLLGGMSRISNSRGTLIGGVIGLIANLWLSAGSLLYSKGYPTFPPLPVNGCAPNFVREPVNLTRNEDCTIYLPDENAFLDTLKGMENFYSVSYIWYPFFGLTLTVTIGFLASLILRNRDEEEKLDEKLLISLSKYFREFRCNLKSTDSDDCKELKLLNHQTYPEPRYV